jgi:predicted nucleic acid-binding protein
LTELAAAPIRRHALADLLSGAWGVRDRLRLVDALYVELAGSLGSLPLVTTDARLASQCELAELVKS